MPPLGHSLKHLAKKIESKFGNDREQKYGDYA